MRVDMGSKDDDTSSKGGVTVGIVGMQDKDVRHESGHEGDRCNEKCDKHARQE